MALQGTSASTLKHTSLLKSLATNQSELVSCGFLDEALLNKAERFKKNFVNKLKVLTISGQGRSSLVSKAQGMDLVFLLDYSESVGQANFNRALDFVDSMIEYFGISSVREGTHVAVIVFAERPKLIFNLESTRVYEKKVALEELCKYSVLI